MISADVVLKITIKFGINKTIRSLLRKDKKNKCWSTKFVAVRELNAGH